MGHCPARPARVLSIQPWAPVYVDASLLVVDKPPGLLAVPGRGADKQDCLAARVQTRYPDARVVHRLDMATSGLLAMARGAMAQRTLSAAFAMRAVSKRYIAVVAGRLDPPPADWGVIELPIAADWPNRPRRIVDPLHGKPSITRWRVAGYEHGGANTRVELEPVTGRTHQLRVHLRAIGHPILGDTLYAPSAVQDASARLLLHATTLRFAHPASGEAMTFASRVPF